MTMKENTKVAFWIAISIYGGIIATVLLISFLDVIKNWQELVSGVMSVTAAIVTIIFIHRQISQSDQQEKERLDRRFSAARATLPLILSAICDYCIKSTNTLKDISNWRIALDDGNLLPNPTSPPTEVIRDIERMIEATPSKGVRNRLSDMISQIQVFDSVMKGLFSDRAIMEHSKREGRDNLLIKAAMIYSMADSLFPYSRREKDAEDEIIWKNIFNSLNILRVRDDQFPEIYKKLYQRRDLGKPPIQF